MNRLKPSLLLIAFIACFFVVGIPYWGVPYNKVSLPSTLIGPGLLVVWFASLLLRFYGVSTFWKAVVIMAMSIPMAVFARVTMDTIKDPTSHNLWPLEIIIAAAIGFICVLCGAVVGNLFARLTSRLAKRE